MMFETAHYIQGSVIGLRAAFSSETLETTGSGMTIQNAGGKKHLPVILFEQTIFHK